MATKTIKVKSPVNSASPCAVKPGKFHAKGSDGDSVQWKNETGGDIIIMFPHYEVFFTTASWSGYEIVEKGTTSRAAQVKPHDNAIKDHVYYIHCDENGGLAKNVDDDGDPDGSDP